MSSAVVHYVGVAKYLLPRLPTQAVLDQWNRLSPPTEMVDAHQRFAASMESFLEAHHAFNEAVFNRSNTTAKAAGENLEAALQSHLQLREDVEQQLDEFVRAKYKVSLGEVPEIVVSLEQ